MSKARSWCFTDNNCRSTVVNALFDVKEGTFLEPTDLHHRCNYLYVSKEVGASGTPHYQGYITFDIAVRMSTVKKALECKEVHLEVARGSPISNEEYIAHTGKHSDKMGLLCGPISVGTRPAGQGSRTDISRAVSVLRETKSLIRVAEETPDVFLKYHTGLSKMNLMFNRPPKVRDLHVSVFWGPPGTGKSWRAVHDSDDGTPVVCKGTNNNLWWDDYDHSQRGIILDELRGNTLPYTLLLRVLDPYPLQVDNKGGRLWAHWTRVIITSNLHPSMWYPKIPNAWELADGSDGTLKRRIHSIVFFGDNPRAGTSISEEAYLYSLQHPIGSTGDVQASKITADMVI